MSVDFRLRLLEKAVEMRDCGQMVRAQQLVEVANWLKKRIEAIEERGPPRRLSMPAKRTGSTSRQDQNWMRVKSRRGSS